MAASAAGDISPVRMTGIAPLPGNGFRALYADGQEVRMRQPVAQPEEEEDPLEQLRAEAFAQGFEAGSRTMAESLGEDNDSRLRLIAALEQLGPASSGTLATMLSAAVVRLVGQIVGEVAVDADLLRQRCEAVASLVDETEGKGALRLNPEDLPLVAGVEIGVQIVADPQMRRGSVRLDTAEGWIEDGPDVRMSRLKALLDDMEGKL